MFDALYIGATGMQAQQLNVDTIANNLANVNTSGFKKGRVSFTDLVMREAAPVQPATSADGGLDVGVLAAIPRVGAAIATAVSGHTSMSRSSPYANFGLPASSASGQRP